MEEEKVAIRRPAHRVSKGGRKLTRDVRESCKTFELTSVESNPFNAYANVIVLFASISYKVKCINSYRHSFYGGEGGGGGGNACRFRT